MLAVMLYEIINVYKYKKIINTKKVCLCVIGKNENLYIGEFINYYNKLGYNHIFLYDNNNINDERFDDVIKNEKDFVSIINYRGFRGKEENPQLDAYRDCYDKNNKYYKWLSFFDIDEYLEFNPKNIKIQNFLSNNKFRKCKVIKINWLYYMDINSLYYKNISLQKRIKIPIFNSNINRHIKSTVMGNLPNNYWLKAQNPHTSLNNYITCSSSGKIINSSSPFNLPIEFEFAYLKHYQMKSFEEYCMKIKRGRPVPQYMIYRKQKIYELIKDNINNNKKIKIIEKIFNISIINYNNKLI
jgi:hypothetical protein